jgi:hypothetical protein
MSSSRRHSCRRTSSAAREEGVLRKEGLTYQGSHRVQLPGLGDTIGGCITSFCSFPTLFPLSM